MSDAKFSPSTVEVFMGGDFHLGQPKTVRGLRKVLADMDKELAGWGDDTEIAEVWTDHGKVLVTLKAGIAQ